MINCGGMRTELQPGDLTLRNMQEMVPFGNTVNVFTCTGAQLINMLEWNLEMGRTREHDILSFYPITYDVKEIGGKQRVFGVKINGQIFEIARYYTGISHDYVLSHSDKYMKFTPQKIYDTGDLMVNKLIDYVREHQTVGN
jgi:5'-nucleotidase